MHWCKIGAFIIVIISKYIILKAGPCQDNHYCLSIALIFIRNIVANPHDALNNYLWSIRSLAWCLVLTTLFMFVLFFFRIIVLFVFIFGNIYWISLLKCSKSHSEYPSVVYVSWSCFISSFYALLPLWRWERYEIRVQ